MISEQKEAFLNSWFDADDGYHWSHGMANQVEQEVSERFDEAMRAYTRAAPDVPELVRYSAVRRYGREEIIEKDEHGEYVLHSQAAEIIAAKDAEIYFDASLRITYKSLCETLNEECGKRFKRAEAAEAKNIELEAAWLNAEGKISDLEAKLAQYEAQKPVAVVELRVSNGRRAKHIYPINLDNVEAGTTLYASPAPAADLKEV